MTTTTKNSEKIVPVAPLQIDLRDWFAGQAIAGVCGPTPDGWSLSPQDHAAWAYQIADAMLEARK